MEPEPAFLSGRTLAVLVAVAGAGVLYVLGRLVLARVARPAYPMPEHLADRARAARALLLRIWGYAVAGGLVLALVGLLPGAGGQGFLLAGVVGVLALLAVAAVFRDVAGGFSILLEGQMWPGDRVRLLGPDVEGVVEDVRLRRTVLREDGGSRVVVPNGKIGAVRSISAGPARARSSDEERPPSPETDTSREKEETPGRAEDPGEGAEPPGEILSESPWSIE